MLVQKFISVQDLDLVKKNGKPLTLSFNRTRLFLSKKQYENGRNAIELVDRHGEVYIVASINLPNIDLKENEIIIKNYSENHGLLDILLKTGFLEKTGKTIELSFVTVDICRVKL